MNSKVLTCSICCDEDIYEDKGWLECFNCGATYKPDKLKECSLPVITHQGEIVAQEIPLIEE